MYCFRQGTLRQLSGCGGLWGQAWDRDSNPSLCPHWPYSVCQYIEVCRSDTERQLLIRLESMP